jgi:hypothetical protein
LSERERERESEGGREREREREEASHVLCGERVEEGGIIYLLGWTVPPWLRYVFVPLCICLSIALVSYPSIFRCHDLLFSRVLFLPVLVVPSLSLSSSPSLHGRGKKFKNECEFTGVKCVAYQIYY